MRYKVLLLVFTVVCASCAQRADINYRIVTGQPLQVMEHFGASDAWSMHVLGKWPEEKQKQIADWLFSTENDANGKPKGIGLSLWRFNLGAGSTGRATPARLVLLGCVPNVSCNRTEVMIGINNRDSVISSDWQRNVESINSSLS